MTAHDPTFYEQPSLVEAELAAEASRSLSTCSMIGEAATIRIIELDTSVTVPAIAMKMFADILEQMALGNAISIMPIHTELTTQEAADMLNVSRPYLIQQVLEQGKIPFHQAGNRRKIYLKDVLEFKTQQQKQVQQVMAEAAFLSQSLNIVD